MSSEANKAMIGSVLLVGSQLAGRLMGLVSTLVLARLLVPEDFGIVAIAFIVIHLFELLVLTGTSQYIIQKDTVDDEDLNTAWTLDICLRVGVAILLVLAAPFAADFYGDPRLENVVRVLSLLVIIGPFINPEMQLLQRKQQYKTIFYIDLIRKFISVPITISIAYWFQTYWALIIGHFASTSIQVIGSYVALKYRPKVTLCRVKEQWQFTKWIMFKGIIGYCRGQLDTFLVSKFFGVSQVGAYHVMKYVGTMPASQIITPATQPLLASFSRKKNDHQGLQYQFDLAFIALAIITVPLTVYVYQFSLPLVELLLGEKWIQYHSVFGILTILSGSMALGNLSSHIIVAKGKVKSLFIYDVLTLLIMISVLWYAKNLTIDGFTLSRVGVDLIINFALFTYASVILLRANIAKSLVVIAVILPMTILIGEVSQLAVNDISLPLFQVVVSSLSFGILYVLGIVALYLLYWRKTEEGRHIQFLVVSNVTKAKCKLLPAK